MAKGDIRARYWVGICYPENMVDDWQTNIGDLLELPYAYCIHDRDLDKDGDDRKIHVHLIIAFPNTTTYSNALRVFRRLDRPGFQCINKCEVVANIRHKYNYLIHDTDDSRKKGKFLYPASDRITGNNFDIGCYEQVSQDEIDQMAKELCNFLIDNRFINFTDFFLAVQNEFDSAYFRIVRSYSGLFERIIRGNFLKFNSNRR